MFCGVEMLGVKHKVLGYQVNMTQDVRQIFDLMYNRLSYLGAVHKWRLQALPPPYVANNDVCRWYSTGVLQRMIVDETL